MTGAPPSSALSPALRSAGFELIPIAKDGNCMFTSFAAGFNGKVSAATPAHATQLRHVVCGFMVRVIGLAR
jgi:hypothetical protein